MTKTIRKKITVDKVEFTLEIYPARIGCTGVEGPYYEIFPKDYHAALYAFSNKEKLNDVIKKKHL
jgi:hypothetical protein